MKITIIAQKLNFCTNQLVAAAKVNRVEVETVDFSNLPEALNYDAWGDVVIWRSSTLDKNLDRVLLFNKLKEDKIIFNIGQYEHPLINSKFYQQAKVAEYARQTKSTTIIPIETFKFQDLADFQLHANVLQFPCIEKPDDGAHGDDVRLIKSSNDLGDFAGKIYQNFIKNDGDFRVVCLGGMVLGCIKRIARKDDIRNNISQGGRAEVVTDPKLITDLSHISLQIAALFNLNLCGLDIIFDQETQQLKFLEINNSVWWEGFSKITNIDVASKIIEHCVALYKRKTESPVKAVKDYYDYHYDDLGPEQFHFASRLYFWLKDKKYGEKLKQLETQYLGTSEAETDAIIKTILARPTNSTPNRNESQLRAQIFSHYPNLDNYSKVLSVFMFAQTVYQRDIAANLLKYISLEDLLAYRDQLYGQPEHFCILSTFALNYCYTLDLFLKTLKKEKLSLLQPQLFLELAETEYQKPYLSQKYNLQLYYYTHCIINAAGFYSKKITKDKSIYREMLLKCEQLISSHYFEMDLDCKLEFLVCAQLLGYKSTLTRIIYSECTQSLSNMGNYLIERWNKSHYLKHRAGLQTAEHRNVLFIMAFHDMIATASS